MKKKAGILLACMFALALPVSVYSANAESIEGAAPETVNLLADENNWKHNKTGSNNPDCVKFENGVLKVTPKYVVGSTYCAKALGQGRISFTYQLSYPDNVPLDTADDLAEQIEWVKEHDFFFGVLFGNSPVNVKPSGDLAVPFNEGAGGFPYMVAFDSEKQGDDPVRATQLGLTLRRYKSEGSHDFTRWSSVNPTEATYINNDGKSYESKIPAEYHPVTLAECFDIDEHKVDIDVKNLYKEKGDEVDAVQIEVYFDDALSLRVIDEMPFEHDRYDEEIDKRTRDGWISTYAYAGTTDAATQYEEFTVNFKSFTAQFGESNGSTGGEGGEGDETENGGGCSSSMAVSAVCISAGLLFVACGTVALIVAKKKNSNGE